MAEEEKKMSRNQRYHALHREERCAKRRERYYNSPEVIAKKEEHERKKIEKELLKKAEKEAKKAEKLAELDKARQEVLQLALATKKQTNRKGALTEFLVETSSGERDED